jgi:hypothetical protein
MKGLGPQLEVAESIRLFFLEENRGRKNGGIE